MYKKRIGLVRTQYLNVEEVALLCGAPNRKTLLGARDFAILKTFLNTGLRRNELINLKVDDLRHDENGYYLIVHSKGGTTDEQLIGSEETVEAIKKYMTWSGHDKSKLAPIFQPIAWRTKTESKKINRQSLDFMIKKYAKKVGIYRKISCHTLRHTFGTEYYAITKDIVITQRAMRHRSITSTSIYVHADDSRVRQGLERMHL